MTETWRATPSHEGYEVSDHGRVRSIDRYVWRENHTGGHWMHRNARYIAITALPTGHLRVALSQDGVRKAKFIHRLVLEAFVGPCPDGMEGCHNDGNPANNKLENLRWDTKAANVADSVKHGTNRESRKTHCPRGHELVPPNLVPCSARVGQRVCLACSRGLPFARYHARRLGVTFTDDQIAAICGDYHARILNAKEAERGT